jgi:internalin A
VRLTVLQLHFNSIENVSPLATLVLLEQLDLSYNSFGDVDPLAALVRLTDLQLHFNSIEDVSPLASLVKMQTLTLYNNAITTGVADLVTLTQATSIDLSTNNSMPCDELHTLIDAFTAGFVLPSTPEDGVDCAL